MISSAVTRISGGYHDLSSAENNSMCMQEGGGGNEYYHAPLILRACQLANDIYVTLHTVNITLMYYL